MIRPTRTEAALAIMRLATAAFFAIWAIEKIVAPEAAIRVAETFYGASPDPVALAITGTAQLILILAFAAGLWRAWTTGALFLIHTASVATTIPRLIDPYTLPNHLFWAGVPILALLAGLWLMRAEDRWLTIAPRTRLSPAQP